MKARIAAAALAIASIAAITAGGIAVELITLSTLDTGQTIDVSFVDKTITCNITVTNQGNAPASAGCEIESPSGHRYGCTALFGVGDIWSCPITVPGRSEPGTYSVHNIWATSVIGSGIRATAADLIADPLITPGGAADLDIAATAPTPDATTPTPTAFTSYPSQISSVNGGLVTCDSTIDPDTIGLPGVYNANGQTALHTATCAFIDPNGKRYGCGGPVTSCEFTIPPASPVGFWLLEGITSGDIARNKTRLSRTDVVAIGGSSFIDVNASPGTGGTGGVGPGDDPCVQVPDNTTTDGWFTSTAQEFAATELLYFKAFVRSSGAGSVIAIGNEDSDVTPALTENAILVRFNASGNFEAWDGTAYTEGNGIPYTDNAWYKVNVYADVAAGTFSVEVGDCDGGVMKLLLDDAAFQTGAPTTNGLLHFHYFAPAATSILSVDLYNRDRFGWFSSSCSDECI